MYQKHRGGLSPAAVCCFRHKTREPSPSLCVLSEAGIVPKAKVFD